MYTNIYNPKTKQNYNISRQDTLNPMRLPQFCKEWDIGFWCKCYDARSDYEVYGCIDYGTIIKCL